MTQNQNDNGNADGGFTDPPEGLKIIEWVPNQKFLIREFAPWSTKIVGSLFLAVGIAVLLIPITQDYTAEDLFGNKFGNFSQFVSQVLRAVLVVAVLCLFFQMMKLLFGSTAVLGTQNQISSCKKLFGIPLTRAMSKNECQGVELKYYRGRRNSESGLEGVQPGDWKVSMIGRSSSLNLYRTSSMEQAKWLSRFLSEWYDVKFEQTRNKGKFGW